MRVLDRAKLVREVCKIVHSIAAMATSAAAANTFMHMDKPCRRTCSVLDHRLDGWTYPEMGEILERMESEAKKSC